MSSSQSTVPFGAGRALGFFLEVAKAKPGSFAALSVMHVALYAVLSIAMTLSTALQVEAMMAAPQDPGADPAAMVSAMGTYVGFMLLGLLVFAVLAVWVEAVWLRLMVRGQASLLPRPGDFGRVLLAFIVIYAIVIGVYFAGLLVMTTVAMTIGMFDQMALSILIGGIGTIVLLVLMVWLIVRLSALPAMCVLERRFAFGRAFSGTGKIFWPLLGAWFLWLLIYIGLSVVGVALVWLMPGPYSEAVFAGFTHMNDPTAQLSAYRAAFESPGGVILAVLTTALGAAIYLPGVWIARGIACRAALDISQASRTAGEDRSSPDAAPGGTTNSATVPEEKSDAGEDGAKA